MPSMAALTDWVEKGGGGLLVAGGESVFGESGYRKTPIERLTPVTFERKDEPEVALVIVLDRSWSMAGSSMELTKAAAQAAVDVMTDEQSVGILTFNDKFDWDVTLRNVGKNRDAIRKKIAAIGPGGHTLIFPAVEQAYLALRNAKARAKHVILLSDGRSYPGDYEALVKKMAEARITVSTVAVGPSADPELLKNLANWGKGRAYAVADATQVPEIFVKEAKNAVHPGLRREGDHAGREDAGLPRRGESRAHAEAERAHRDRAEGRRDRAGRDRRGGSAAGVLADRPRPHRGVRLGRQGSLGGRLGALAGLRTVLRLGGPRAAAAARAAGGARRHARPGARRRRAIAVAVEARDANGQYRNLLSPAVQVRTATPPTARGQLRHVARRHPPGRARPLRGDGDGRRDAARHHRPRRAGCGDGGRRRPAAPSCPIRRPSTASGRPTRRCCARSRRRPAAPGIRRRRRSPTPRATAAPPAARCGPALVALALALWFVDLLLRRVRVFEPRLAEA